MGSGVAAKHVHDGSGFGDRIPEPKCSPNAKFNPTKEQKRWHRINQDPQKQRATIEQPIHLKTHAALLFVLGRQLDNGLGPLRDVLRLI